jgi:arylsulfate sulfotransferase
MLSAGNGENNCIFERISLMSNMIARRSRARSATKEFIIAASVLIAALHSSNATQADDTSIILVSKAAGATPFIRQFNFKVTPISNLNSVQFTIQPKPGSVTRPLSATYSRSYLSSRDYLNPNGDLKVPIFGLYDGFTNTVSLNYVFNDQSFKQSVFSILTPAYHDPCRYNQRTTVVARTRSTSLSYDFMLLKNSCGNFSPALMDTDGALRWVGTAGVDNVASAFLNNGIYIGSGAQLLRIELDGTVSVIGDYSSIGVTDFHHNIDPGKYGLFVEVDTQTDIESVILEINANGGGVRKRWDMAKIISTAMRAGGDDPSAFVRRGEDWFHNNSVTYRASDDSIIISSRENFVIALDYGSSAIKWILGDTSKAWYQYPSLRQYALTVPPGGVAPIGEHALSITYNDKLLLFDNGLRSFSQNPPGNSRKFAAPRKYSLNLAAGAAKEIYSYDRPIVSEICSSVYEDAPNNYLVDYAVAGGYLSGNPFAEIVGLQANGQRVFDYKYPTRFCDEVFNAIPVHLEQLSF